MPLRLILVKKTLSLCFQPIQKQFIALTKPTGSSKLTSTLKDLFRPKSELLAENALVLGTSRIQAHFNSIPYFAS